ncbi:MAG: ATP-binding protein [Actinobacteria bacterium]|nr:ATP-binding protein [Actinomycetota bacterium]
MTSDESSVRLTIPAKAEYIALCRLALAGLARMRPVSEETLADLKLALTEACSNSVRHAYKGDGEGTVEIVYRLELDRLVIDVLDDGKGFSLEDAPGAEEMNESGLGLAIIRSLTDELEVRERENGRGSMIRFAKALST